MRGAILASLLFALFSGAAFAEPSTPPRISGYVHTYWKEREGLPGGGIYHITETDDGYMWLATASGLLRFDGHRFERWQPFDGTAAIDGPVLAMSKGHDRALWLGLTNGKTVRVADGHVQMLPDAPTMAVARGMQHADDGSLWLFHDPLGLRRLVNGEWHEFKDDPYGSRVHGVSEDSAHRIWVAS